MTSAGNLFNQPLWNEDLWNGFAPDANITSHAVYFKETSIRLRWNPVDLADRYNVQVSLNPDFSGDDVENEVTADTFLEFTDSDVNDAKRYWRWRWSRDGGASYSEWMGIGSYWLNTGGALNVSVALNKLMLINPENVTDRRYLGTFPIMSVQPQVFNRVFARNRLGALLSEYVTMKAMITCAFGDEKFLQPDTMRLVRRFHEEVKTFFIAGFWEQEPGNPIANIWKVQLFEDPVYVFAEPNRHDIIEAEMKFTEV